MLTENVKHFAKKLFKIFLFTNIHAQNKGCLCFVQLTTFTIISWRKAHITVSLNIIPVVFKVYS